MKIKGLACTLLAILILISSPSLFAQKRKKNKKTTPEINTELYNKLEYRLVGPFRGGRSAAVTGITGNEKVFYMGSTGGGVWQTENAGETWTNISDGFFGGTIGAVTVAESDNNIVFAAGGEKTIRGNVSHGYGIWKSIDGGETWNYKGLKECQYIPRLRIHPTNPDLIYAAALGHLFGPNNERGVYRSFDGGETWENILFVNKDAGAIDLILDPVNPRIIYASTWNVRRTPYSLESGGEGSGLWISRDAGDSWKEISKSEGFPKGVLGIIGVSVSQDDPRKVYALAEAHNGGLFVSNNRGESWTKVNSDRNLRQRAWYYTRLYADPNNAETIYVLNVGFHKSVDGGKTFKKISTPHGDHHDLWIDPDNSNIMIIGDDGGAQISHDGGLHWSSMMNQPTSQFYRVVCDNHFPYRIYGGQQDNSAVRIDSRSLGRGGITEDNWESTAGGESAWIAPDPNNNDVVYGGSYGGLLLRLNHRTGERRRIDIWPDNPMGWGADSLKERFQWNFPIKFSKHDTKCLYAASNRLFKTTNEGQSWEAISPDLTRNDKSKMGPSGGPITNDNTSVEYYGTIFTFTESDIEKDLIWSGSDDGLIHITKDGGGNWEDVTPGNELLPDWTMINSIEADPFSPGGLFVAACGYKQDDFTPYLLHTIDYGKSWKLITHGINKDHFTRVIRADKKREGLLFCGTESGMYISFNNGVSWKEFQLNLPIVPVTDLVVKNNELIVATQGRAFWSFDYIDVLRVIDNSLLENNFSFMQPSPAYSIGGRSSSQKSLVSGQGMTNGVVFNFFLKDTSDIKFRLEIYDNNNTLAKAFVKNIKGVKTTPDQAYQKTELKEGFNQLVWNLSYPSALSVKGMIMWSGSLAGPKAVPGTYRALAIVNSDTIEHSFDILRNPNSDTGVEDLIKQRDFLIVVRDKLSETHQAILDIRQIKKNLGDIQGMLAETSNKELINNVIKLKKSLNQIENELYQTKNKSSQDPLNYPIKLGNKLAALNGVVGTGDYPPTDQSYKVREELIKLIDIQLDKLAYIRINEINKLNTELAEIKLPYIKN